MGHSRPLFLYFWLFVTLESKQMFCMLRSGLELQTCSVGRNRFANWAKTCAQNIVNLRLMFAHTYGSSRMSAAEIDMTAPRTSQWDSSNTSFSSPQVLSLSPFLKSLSLFSLSTYIWRIFLCLTLSEFIRIPFVVHLRLPVYNIFINLYVCLNLS